MSVISSEFTGNEPFEEGHEDDDFFINVGYTVSPRASEVQEKHMLDYFQACVSENILDAIDGFYANFNGFRATYGGLELFIKYLIVFLCKYECENILLVIRIFRLQEKFIGLGEYLSMDTEITSSIHRDSSKSSLLDCRLRHEDCNLNFSRLTFFAVQDGYHELLSALVKYGFAVLPRINPEIVSSLQSNISQWSNYKANLYRDEDDVGDLSFRRFVFRFTEEDSNQLKFNIIPVIWTIDIVISSLSGQWVEKKFGKTVCQKDMMQKRKCLELLVEATSLPFVNETHILEFFHFCFDTPTIDAFLETICDTFRSMFPQSAELSQPRSLLHLCRCKVRDCLQKSSPLQKQVSKLTVPGPIKKYLLFNDLTLLHK